MCFLDTPLKELVFAIAERKNQEILSQILILVDNDICCANTTKYLLLMKHLEFVLGIAAFRGYTSIQFERVSSTKQQLFRFVVFLLGFDGVEMDGECDRVAVRL